MRVEKSDNFELYLGDARDVIPDGGQVDLVVTDPPYKLTSGGDTEGGMKGGFFNDYNNNGDLVECDIEWHEIAQIVHNSIKIGSHAYVMANNRNYSDMEVAHKNAGLGFHNLLVWHKRSATANRWYMKDCEFTGFFYKERSKRINECGSKQLASMYQEDESGSFSEDGNPHPTEKPVNLLKHYIINSSKAGETVLDPFAGSGSTGVAAIQSGRQFIGIEKDEAFFEMCLARLRHAEKNIQEDMFNA